MIGRNNVDFFVENKNQKFGEGEIENKDEELHLLGKKNYFTIYQEDRKEVNTF